VTLQSQPPYKLRQRTYAHHPGEARVVTIFLDLVNERKCWALIQESHLNSRARTNTCRMDGAEVLIRLGVSPDQVLQQKPGGTVTSRICKDVHGQVSVFEPWWECPDCADTDI
jgi:hypothetical protein